MLKAIVNSPVRSGDQTIVNGDLIVGTAGEGVNFTANTPAAGMTSQLLNWYEEGTFSPTVVGSTSAGTATYQYGTTARYTRIGRVVYVEIWISWISGTGTGNFHIGGLPFSQGGGVPNPGISIGYLNGMSWTAGATPCAIIAGTEIQFKQMPSGGGSVTGLPYSASGDLFVSAFYSV